LAATQVVARVNDLLHVALPAEALFDAPTVAELAAAVSRHRRGAAVPGS
jgi:acyl carrier protein